MNEIIQKTPMYKDKNFKKAKDLNPLEKIKHLKMKNKNFYKLCRSLTWQI